MEQKTIRNFALSHILTMASQLLPIGFRINETIAKDKIQEQFLDQSLLVEKRHYHKLAPVKMNYTLNAIDYTLNLLILPDTLIFLRVSRTLAACEGAYIS